MCVEITLWLQILLFPIVIDSTRTRFRLLIKEVFCYFCTGIPIPHATWGCWEFVDWLLLHGFCLIRIGCRRWDTLRFWSPWGIWGSTQKLVECSLHIISQFDRLAYFIIDIINQSVNLNWKFALYMQYGIVQLNFHSKMAIVFRQTFAQSQC